MTCHDQKALGAYIDGELQVSQILLIEQHLTECDTCAERVALGRGMKRALRASADEYLASASLRARIGRSAALVRASAEEASRAHRAPTWKSALPWAVAAAIALSIGGGVRALSRGGIGGAGARADASAEATYADMLDDFAVDHARPLPPEEVDPARINRIFSPIVGVPVRPVRLETMPRQHSPASFAGGRLTRVNNSPAATLYYNVNGTRVTMFVFDPQRISLRHACCLVPHVVSVSGQERSIYLGRAKGYPLAVFERDGVGYAVSADLTDTEVLAIAAGL